MSKALRPQNQTAGPSQIRRGEELLIRAILSSAPWAGGEPDFVEQVDEITMTDMEELRASLLGPNPSPVEAAVVGAALAGWLLARLADIAAATNGGNQKAREFHLRTAERGTRRFLSATLATVRRLVVGPQVVQVNIGGQKVNTVRATGSKRKLTAATSD